MAYEYKPLEDSLLGETISRLLTDSELSIFKSGLYSYLEPGIYFKGTPKVEKQILMTSYPEEIRKLLQAQDHKKIIEKFRILLKGKTSVVKEPKIDIALEIIEWVIFGCEQDQLGIALINELSSNKFSFNENLLLKLKAEYSKLS